MEEQQKMPYKPILPLAVILSEKPSADNDRATSGLISTPTGGGYPPEDDA